MIPHGTLIAQMDSKQIESLKHQFLEINISYVGNLNRVLKEQLMKEAKLETPKFYTES